MSNHVHTAIWNGEQYTLDQVVEDLNSGNYTPLYFVTEDEISTLIDQGRIEEDFFSRHQDYQEEMRCMMAET